MEKNYNYNYENKSQGQKLPIGYSNLGVSSCTSKVLAKSPVTNGSLWYTTDKDEFYYDWNGSRIKLNLTGDSSKILAELDKIKDSIKNLNPDAVQKIVKELEGKVNGAVSTVNSLKTDVDSAVKEAKDAVAQVENKADITYVDNKIAGKVDVSVVTTLQNTVSDLETSISNKANASDVTALSQSISNKADRSTVETLAQSVTSLSDAVSNKVDASVVTALDAKVDGFQTAIDAKPDMTAVESAITSAIANKADKSDLNSKADAADVEALQTELGNKADKTDLDGKVNQDTFNELKDTVNKIQIPTKVSKFENDKNYITYLDIKDDLLTSEDRAALDAIKDLGASDVETGKFPVVDLDTPTDPTEAALNGLATVQDVMNYVNALIEKKKDDLAPSGEVKDYLYVNGVKIEDLNNLPTPTSIYQMNQYEINEDILTNGIIVLTDGEANGFYGGDGNIATIYSVVFAVEYPQGYTCEVYKEDELEDSGWAVQDMVSNPRYQTKMYGSKTYVCKQRNTISAGDDGYAALGEYSPYSGATDAQVKYKITLNKNQ